MISILIPMGIVLAITSFFYFMLRLLKVVREKAGFITSFLLLVFFSYGYIVGFWEGCRIGHIVALVIVVPIIILFLPVRMKNFTNALNLVSIVLILFPLTNVALSATGSSKQSEQDIGHVSSRGEQSYPERDIFHIVVDAYAGSTALQEYYGFDNSSFFNHLRRKGFVIADESYSNYPATWWSLSSMLNMRYLETKNISCKEAPKWFESEIRNNVVARKLKSHGYKYVYIGSGWESTKDNEHADIVYKGNKWINTEFLMALGERSFLKFLPLWVNYIKYNNRRNVIDSFENLEKALHLKDRKYVFAHIFCPHPPFVLGKGGENVPESELELVGAVWKNKERYLNQLLFTNGKLIQLIDKIFEKASNPPIIILQSDHGSSSSVDHDIWYDKAKPTTHMLKEQFCMFNSFYFPDRAKIIPNGITPVNIFRRIFNHYFGSTYELLKRKNYFVTNTKPFTFHDVTEDLMMPKQKQPENG